MLITGVAVISLILAVITGILTVSVWAALAAFVGALLGQALLIFVALVIICGCVDLNKVQERDAPFFRWLVDLLVEAAFPILSTSIKAEGLQCVPKSGRFLLVCNHISDVDPLALLRIFRKQQVCFISKRENDRRFIIGPLLHKIACQPIHRENDREALKTILRCIKMIKEDACSIAVFPEGYIRDDHLLRHFRHGVFKIAQKTGVPIVVCTIRNADKVFHNAARLRRTQVEVHLVKVIQPQEYEGLTSVALSEQVYNLMADDLGPALVYQEGKDESAENT